jgi:hypothetical protein
MSPGIKFLPDRPHDIFGGEPPRLRKPLGRTDTQTGIQHRNVAGMLVGFLGEGVEPENSSENHRPYRGGPRVRIRLPPAESQQTFGNRLLLRVPLFLGRRGRRMEPRSPTCAARILVRPVAEPGLITVGYPSPRSALGCAGHGPSRPAICRRGWDSSSGSVCSGRAPEVPSG